LEHLTAEELQGTTMTALRQAGRQLSSFHKARTSGMMKVSYRAQEFAQTFSDFLDAFSGVVCLVRTAGAPYGEAAYETMSLLLSVIINKSTNDRLFGDLIRDLTIAFPRVEVLMSVYPSSNLQKFVAIAYVDVIMFAREAAEYFTNLKKRIIKAIISPASTGIELKASTIKGRLAEVNNEAMILLHQRNREISQNVAELRDNVRELRESNQELKEGSDELKKGNKELKEGNEELIEGNFKLISRTEVLREEVKNLRKYQMILIDHDVSERLDRLRASLGLEDEPSRLQETHINAVHRILGDVFPGTHPSTVPLRLHAKHPAHRFRQMSQKKFLSHDTFVKWRNEPMSSLLFISGVTEREGRQIPGSTCSWLSPAAIHAAKHLHQTPFVFEGPTSDIQDIAIATLQALQAPVHTVPEDLCIFYTCHPYTYSGDQCDHDPIRMFGVIVWSLFNWSSTSLMRYVEQYRSRVTACIDGRSREQKTVLKELTTLVIDMLHKTEYTANTVWIVLDRVDLCMGKFPHLMAQLVRLLSYERGPKVKILTVADASYIRGWDKDDLDRDDEDRVLFCNEWDQVKTAWHERSSDNLAMMDIDPR
jgi:hypothetical protein